MEKAIKALLVLHQREFRPSHDIGGLLAVLAQDELLPDDEGQTRLESLTRFAVETRYPPGDATPAEAQAALVIAQAFLGWAEARLPWAD